MQQVSSQSQDLRLRSNFDTETNQLAPISKKNTKMRQQTNSKPNS